MRGGKPPSSSLLWTLLAPACADTTAIELMDFMLSSTVILCCIVLVAFSYMYIILMIVSIPSASGRKKAFKPVLPT
uniref:Uncharacterized protein n=1 Tax=Rangifer tarandus platyrhynchus TaxID=3082113 RepID=A0ACB0FD21_RANTA|nr:unnamed protein product [Rangifer tarandus platyrhynchus]